ncbi:MAG: transporter substrate-binding domain-containing protein [Eubacteriales bacterium]|nr:transporter substrate-binding domain-containing protein [Eubacteriales bacterium]
MKKFLCMMLALTMTATLLAGCGAAPADGIQTVTEGKLTVATSPDFAPMEFVDASKEGQDKFVGFDVSLAKYIAQELGLELVVTPMSFDACQTAVAMGSVDMSLSGFSWTEARAENYNLSDYYNTGNEDAQVLITLAANGDKFADAGNVEGLKVGVQTASLQEQITTEQLPNAEKVVFVDLTTALMQLRNGDFDCMAVAEGNASSIIANNPDVALTGYNFYVDPKYTGNVVMMQKGADELLTKVNEILAQAVEQDLYQQWYEEAKALASSGSEVSYDDSGNVAQ